MSCPNRASAGSVNRRVEDRLRAFAHIRQSFGPLPGPREYRATPMSERRVEFKRMVLGLPRSPRDYPAVAAAAQLPGLLRLGPPRHFCRGRGLLIDIAGLPCVRELRALEGGWRPMDISQLARELEHAAATARRLFAEAMRTCSIEAELSFLRGSAAGVVPSLSHGRRRRPSSSNQETRLNGMTRQFTPGLSMRRSGPRRPS